MFNISRTLIMLSFLCVLSTVLNAGLFDKINKGQAAQEGVRQGMSIFGGGKAVSLSELRGSLNQLSSLFQDGYIGVNSQGLIDVFGDIPRDQGKDIEDINRRISKYLSSNASGKSNYFKELDRMNFITYRQDGQGNWINKRKEKAGAPQDLNILIGQHFYLKRGKPVHNGNVQTTGQGDKSAVQSVEGDYLYVVSSEIQGWVFYDAIDYARTSSVNARQAWSSPRKLYRLNS